MRRAVLYVSNAVVSTITFFACALAMISAETSAPLVIIMQETPEVDTFVVSIFRSVTDDDDFARFDSRSGAFNAAGDDFDIAGDFGGIVAFYQYVGFDYFFNVNDGSTGSGYAVERDFLEICFCQDR